MVASFRPYSEALSYIRCQFLLPAQYFGGKGYLIFLPNFRGSIGWGSESMRKNVRDWRGGDYKDIM